MFNDIVFSEFSVVLTFFEVEYWYSTLLLFCWCFWAQVRWPLTLRPPAPRGQPLRSRISLMDLENGEREYMGSFDLVLRMRAERCRLWRPYNNQLVALDMKITGSAAALGVNRRLSFFCFFSAWMVRSNSYNIRNSGLSNIRTTGRSSIGQTLAVFHRPL